MGITTIKTNSKQTVEDALKDSRTGIGYYIENNVLLETNNVDDERCLCKAVVLEDGRQKITKYFIKFSIERKIYNPWDAYGEHRENLYKERAGKKYWSFKEVTKDILNRYIRFLLTGNESHYVIIQRETKDL